MMYWITSTLIKSGAFASGYTAGIAIISILADVFIVYVVINGLIKLYISHKVLKKFKE